MRNNTGREAAAEGRCAGAAAGLCGRCAGAAVPLPQQRAGDEQRTCTSMPMWIRCGLSFEAVAFCRLPSAVLRSQHPPFCAQLASLGPCMLQVCTRVAKLVGGEGLGPALSVSSTAAALRVPLAIAQEHLLTAEACGRLCRDDGQEGLRFFRNFFAEVDVGA